MENRRRHRGNGAFAVGTRNVQRVKTPLGIAQFRQ